MIALRPLHLVICSIALTVAGCANTSMQGTPTADGGAPPRPKTVLVYDLEFSPDIAVVDSKYTQQLESQLGNLLVSKQILAKRVSAEIEATIATILHDETGLRARSGGEQDITPDDSTLVISGQLQAAAQGNQPPRAPVNFGTDGVVVASMTVSEVTGGTKKQLLTFTTSAQSGRRSAAAMTAAEAAGRNAAINAAVATQSVPAGKLSPDNEAQARGLGRAIAARLISYASQQGWSYKTNVPEPTAEAQPADNKREKKNRPEAQPARKKPEKLPAAEARRSEPPPPPPPKIFPCHEFTRNDRGNWYVKGPVTVDIGTAENKTLQNLEIPPKFFTIGGVDLYQAIQKNCGGGLR